MVAVVIGVGLTTFITVFVSFYLVRGYKNLQHTASVDLETTEEEVKPLKSTTPRFCVMFKTRAAVFYRVRFFSRLF